MCERVGVKAGGGRRTHERHSKRTKEVRKERKKEREMFSPLSATNNGLADKEIGNTDAAKKIPRTGMVGIACVIPMAAHRCIVKLYMCQLLRVGAKNFFSSATVSSHTPRDANNHTETAEFSSDVSTPETSCKSRGRAWST